MSAWNMTSVAPVLVSGFEVSRRATPAHSPHGGENGPGVRLVSRPRVLRREANPDLQLRTLPCCSVTLPTHLELAPGIQPGSLR